MKNYNEFKKFMESLGFDESQFLVRKQRHYYTYYFLYIASKNKIYEIELGTAWKYVTEDKIIDELCNKSLLIPEKIMDNKEVENEEFDELETIFNET